MESVDCTNPPELRVMHTEDCDSLRVHLLGGSGGWRAAVVTGEVQNTSSVRVADVLDVVERSASDECFLRIGKTGILQNLAPEEFDTLMKKLLYEEGFAMSSVEIPNNLTPGRYSTRVFAFSGHSCDPRDPTARAYLLPWAVGHPLPGRELACETIIHFTKRPS